MASFEINGFDELMATLDRLGRFEEVAPKMMEAGMEKLQKEVVNAASEHQDTGARQRSIKPQVWKKAMAEVITCVPVRLEKIKKESEIWQKCVIWNL